MKSGERKKVALFVNRPMALQCMTLKYRHKNSMHTMERLVAPLNKSATFSKHPAQQNWCFDYENNDKLHRMNTQNVRKKILHALHFKWTILIKYFSSYIKSVRRELTFLVECISVCIYPSIHLSIQLASYLSIYLSIHPSIYMYLSIYLSTYLSINLFIYLRTFLSTYLSIQTLINLSIM